MIAAEKSEKNVESWAAESKPQPPEISGWQPRDAQARGRRMKRLTAYRPLNINFVAFSPPFWKYSSGTLRSTPSIKLGRAAQGATDSTFAKSIQYCSRATGKLLTM